MSFRGVAYRAQSVATGMGAMLLNQAVETEFRKVGGRLSKDEVFFI